MTNENHSNPLDYVSREVLDPSHRQKTINTLRNSNVYIPAKPTLPEGLYDSDGDFQLPSDITGLTSSQLGQLLAIINGLLLWYGAVLSRAKVDMKTAERVKNFTEAKVRMEIMTDKIMIKEYKAREDKDSYVNINPAVIEAQDWFDAQEAMFFMQEQLYKDMERTFQLVSREITRRGSDFGRENRDGNLR